ncbi:hypothetical protein AAES_71586 [Amazona aestiva]|uniref:Uncharacterized protein n=1 Tax=Amazona aestiva TaxID=12930 RepID=A0A0Q3TQ47_AMAAE|nr:hypothetical protein AAES_71586 [Amazona aestiva]
MRWYKNLISCVTGNTDRNEMVQEADKLRGRICVSEGSEDIIILWATDIGTNWSSGVAAVLGAGLAAPSVAVEVRVATVLFDGGGVAAVLGAGVAVLSVEVRV